MMMVDRMRAALVRWPHDFDYDYDNLRMYDDWNMVEIFLTNVVH